MAKRGKKYRDALAKIDRDALYGLSEGVNLVKETSYSKMDASIDLAVNLGLTLDMLTKTSVGLLHYHTV